MALFDRFRRRDREAAAPLYAAVVARARDPHWYLAGAPDTLDGRFDMVAAVLSMVLLRLEDEQAEPEAARQIVAQLTERFIDDMDAQVRQIGFGDIIVGKHVGRMMGMLGGRLGAYRDGVAAGDLSAALVRNLWRGEPPADGAVAEMGTGLLGVRRALDAVPLATLQAGRLA